MRAEAKGGAHSTFGFTLVELVVSILVLAIGLLGLASTATVVTRMIGQGQRYTDTSALAQQQLEILRARGCDAAGEIAVAEHLDVVWMVETTGRATRRVLVTVATQTGRSTRVDSFVTELSCD